MKLAGVGVIFFATSMATPLFANEMDILLNADRFTGRQTEKKTDEQSLEEMQSYLLETLFLKPFAESDSGVLTEEEQEEMGDNSSKEMQKTLMTRLFAQKLAKQDILGFKKTYLKPQMQGELAVKDVPNTSTVAPYLMGSLAE